MPLNPDALVGKYIKAENRTGYRIESILGKGGFGTTYKVRSLSNNREVALKVLNTTNSLDEIVNFASEALTLVRLQHPHIVRFLDFGRDKQEDVTFIVMALANKGSVRGQHMPLLPQEAVSYIEQTAGGLQHAHNAKIIHRDVKPDNLLLNEHPVTNHFDIWVTDFGIAIATHSFDPLANQGNPGTGAYMAPEHIRKSATEKSDQFSLAVVAYELLTGKRPFPDVSDNLINPPIPIAKQVQNYTAMLAELEKVIGTALEKDEGKRYPDIVTFSRTLRETHDNAIAATLRNPGAIHPAPVAPWKQPVPTNPTAPNVQPGQNILVPPTIPLRTPVPRVSSLQPPIPRRRQHMISRRDALGILTSWGIAAGICGGLGVGTYELFPFIGHNLLNTEFQNQKVLYHTDNTLGWSIQKAGGWSNLLAPIEIPDGSDFAIETIIQGNSESYFSISLLGKGAIGAWDDIGPYGSSEMYYVSIGYDNASICFGDTQTDSGMVMRPMAANHFYRGVNKNSYRVEIIQANAIKLFVNGNFIVKADMSGIKNINGDYDTTGHYLGFTSNDEYSIPNISSFTVYAI